MKRRKAWYIGRGDAPASQNPLAVILAKERAGKLRLPGQEPISLKK